MSRPIFNDTYPVAQLGLTILTCLSSWILFSFLSSLVAIPIFHINPGQLTSELTNTKNIPLQKYLQFVNSIGLFIIPSLILGKLFSGYSFSYLKLNWVPSWKVSLVVLLTLFASLPLIDLIAKYNSMLRLPESLSNIQNYIDKSSKTYQTIAESFMMVNSINGLMVNLFLMALIPAVGEELLFRGVFQRIFTNLTDNAHWGIVISALIFSTIHLEFYGFFPRLALGVMFGYFLVWSGSIWLPILAHFVNNSIAVTIYFLINNGSVSKKMADPGTIADTLIITAIFTLAMGTGLYYLYKKRVLA